MRCCLKYVEVDDVWNYIERDSVFITINSGVFAADLTRKPMSKADSNELTFSANVDQSAFNKQEDQRIAADIDFTVITGDGFKDYSNYRFVLAVDLLKSNVNEGTGQTEWNSITLNSNAHDWIVYTNAKINPDMLTVSEYSGN